MLSCLRKVYFLGKTFNFLAENESCSRKKRKIRQNESATFDDFTSPKQRHLYMYPKILTSSCRQDNRLFIKEYIVAYRNKITKYIVSYRNGTENAKGWGVPTTHLLYHGEGMSLHVRPRVKLLMRLPVAIVLLVTIVNLPSWPQKIEYIQIFLLW